MLPNKSVCSNSSLFDIFQPVLFGQCYGVNSERVSFKQEGLLKFYRKLGLMWLYVWLN